MRRFLMLLPLLAGLTIPAACGDGDGPAAFAMPVVSSTVVATEPSIAATTAPPSETELEILSEGTGRAVAADEILVMHMKAQVWHTPDGDGDEAPEPFANTFPEDGPPLIGQAKDFVPAFEKVLTGVPLGSRVLIASSAADGFGATGNQQAGIPPDSALVFVIDLLDGIAPDAVADGKAVALSGAGTTLPAVGNGKNPTVKIPKVPAPKKLVTELLQRGTGEKVGVGQTIVAQYTGVLWRTGEQFDSSWKDGRTAFSAVLIEPSAQTGGQGVIKGWVEGLAGQKVGSRVLLVIPPALGYGKEGNPQGGIKGTDTLVFIVDLLAVYGKGTG